MHTDKDTDLLLDPATAEHLGLSIPFVTFLRTLEITTVQKVYMLLALTPLMSALVFGSFHVKPGKVKELARRMLPAEFTDAIDIQAARDLELRELERIRQDRLSAGRN